MVLNKGDIKMKIIKESINPAPDKYQYTLNNQTPMHRDFTNKFAGAVISYIQNTSAEYEDQSGEKVTPELLSGEALSGQIHGEESVRAEIIEFVENLPSGFWDECIARALNPQLKENLSARFGLDVHQIDKERLLDSVAEAQKGLSKLTKLARRAESDGKISDEMADAMNSISSFIHLVKGIAQGIK